jgi:cell division protein FtsW
MVSRVDRGPVARWWWTIDLYFLGAFLTLMGLGVILSFAASPAVAERIGLDSYHFVERQIMFMAPALVCMIAVSFMDHSQVRRFALLMLAGAILMMVVVLFAGVEVKGSRRWISIAGLTIQPSEFMKPAFVIVSAWLFSEQARRPDIPGNLFAIILFGLVAALLVAQPDLGQTILISATWGAMFFIAGMSWLWIIMLGGIALGGGYAAYALFPHVALRIDKFLTGEGDTFQVDTGREAIISGGWLGQGPGEGVVKRILPDSHTDFIFSVAAEEFGIIMCMCIALLFALIVMRGLRFALRERDDFTRLAVAGLVCQFGFQSVINIAVNLQLMPAKGMTLPFISYGGSSLVATAIGTGFVLALTRRKAQSRIVMPPLKRGRAHLAPAE